MTNLQKVKAASKPLVIGKRAAPEVKPPLSVEELLATMAADLAEIKAMLKKALG